MEKNESKDRESSLLSETGKKDIMAQNITDLRTNENLHEQNKQFENEKSMFGKEFLIVFKFYSVIYFRYRSQ